MDLGSILIDEEGSKRMESSSHEEVEPASDMCIHLPSLANHTIQKFAEKATATVNILQTGFG